MNYWAGIDPGKTGAIAAITEDGKIWAQDWPGDEAALNRLLGAFNLNGKPQKVYLEHQQSFGREGRNALASIMENFGMWKAALACYEWPVFIVRPNTWKTGLGYPPKDPKKSKQHSITLVRRWYPHAYDLVARAKDHGRAEAIILAHLAKEGKL